VLQFLLERAQEIVTKQDLFDRVWGGLAVTDDSLSTKVEPAETALSSGSSVFRKRGPNHVHRVA
jgi:DNA-binding winged helix-turn-helix (wHTH) protein